MGWGLGDPLRLLRKSWTDARELAMELYSMATDTSTSTVEHPVEMRSSPGRPALTIVPARQEAQQPAQAVDRRAPAAGQASEPAGTREAAPEPARPAGVQPAAGVAIQVATEAASAAKRVARTVESSAAVGKAFIEFAPAQWLAKRAVETIVGNLAVSEPPRATQVADRSPMQEQWSPPNPNPIPVSTPSRAKLVTSKTQDLPRVSKAGDLPRVTRPQEVVGHAIRTDAEPGAIHADPVLDVTGPVVFRGSDPVQFSTPPEFFNRESGRYESVITNPALTGVNWPRWLTNNTRLCWIDANPGVTAATLRQPTWPTPSPSTLGSGKAQLCDLSFEDGTINLWDDTAKNIDVWSICQFPIGNCFAIAQLWGNDWFVFPVGPAVHCVSRGVIAANSSATCDIYMSPDGSDVAPIGSGAVVNSTENPVGKIGHDIVHFIAVMDGAGILRVVAENQPQP